MESFLSILDFLKEKQFTKSLFVWKSGVLYSVLRICSLRTLVFNSLQTRLKWHIHEQLKTFTDYAIVIQAFNRMGSGPKSREIIVTTMEDGKLRSNLLSCHNGGAHFEKTSSNLAGWCIFRTIFHEDFKNVNFINVGHTRSTHNFCPRSPRTGSASGYVGRVGASTGFVWSKN